MYPILKFPAAVGVLAVGMLLSPWSLAQGGPPAPLGQQLTQLAGGMFAVAERCGSHTKEELNALEDQQRAQSLALGMAEAEFEKHFAIGKAESIARWDTGSRAMQREACREMATQFAR